MFLRHSVSDLLKIFVQPSALALIAVNRYDRNARGKLRDAELIPNNAPQPNRIDL
jgi:hypothetical protein